MDFTAPRTLSLHLIDPLRTLQCTYLAAVTLLVWEWLITFDSEVSLVWKRRWSLGKVLFLINRYTLLTFLLWDTIIYFQPSLLPLERCKAYHLGSDTMTLLGSMSIQGILSLRTYAMYQTKLCFIFLALLVVSVTIVSISMWWYIYLRLTTFVLFDSACVYSCHGSLCHTLWYWTWSSNLTVDTVIFLFTIYQFNRNWKLRRSITVDPENFNQLRAIQNSSFLRALFRDGILYYLVIFFVAAINVTLITTEYETTILSFSMSRAVQSIACSRLFLNLRRSLEEPLLSMVSARSPDESDEHFNVGISDRGSEQIGMDAFSIAETGERPLESKPSSSM